jgi:hypothetical protein
MTFLLRSRGWKLHVPWRVSPPVSPPSYIDPQIFIQYLSDQLPNDKARNGVLPGVLVKSVPFTGTFLVQVLLFLIPGAGTF